MPNLTQIAMTAMRAFSPELVNQVSEKAKKYPQTKEGLQQLITESGGQAFVDSAVDFANKAPKVKALFNKAGINPNDLKDSVMRNMQGGNEPIEADYNAVSLASGFKDRLNKLR